MVFSSFEFLTRFVPAFFIIYFLVMPKYRNIVILVGSLVFYAYGEPLYILIMLGSILFNHFFARRITVCNWNDRNKEKSIKAKVWLIVAMVFNFGMLFVFKYANFFIGMVNSVAGRDLISNVNLTLPLGISFYTFQMASYVIDVYRNEYRAVTNPINFATYVSMFPQLIAGPILNYKDVRDDMDDRTAKLDDIEAGVVIFVIGLSFKVLLANKISSLWNDVQTIGSYGINSGIAWLGSLGFTMQIYFDFFGYSLMAIGLGRVMGFHFAENFDNPYCSRSATEFWRRWHITLGRWFREYVYIPLGGNRKGKGRMVFNTFMVWLLTGLWHGADWNFIIWGLFFFVILMIEKLWLKKYLDKSHVLSRLYMFALIPLSWTIFNITDLKELWNYIRCMFGAHLPGAVTDMAMEKLSSLWHMYRWLLLACVFFCTPIPKLIYKKFKNNIVFKLVIMVAFVFSIIQIAKGGSNPFLYFRF